jgi:DNA-binding NtrC family response regulator
MLKHKILIVDDEQNILNSLSRILAEENREILLAHSAEEGLQILKDTEEISVVISDNRLPGMTGVDFMAKVRQLYPDNIRIIITGYADLESSIAAINKGQVYRYVLKPWENEDFKQMVKYALDFYQVIRENRILLRIIRQQVERLKNIKERYPQILESEINKSGLYIIEEQHISESMRDFLKQYYPESLGHE